MSSHHDHDHPVTENKPVAFRTPLILALVTVLAIVLLVSTCDNKHHGNCECKEDCSEECMKKCESGDHSGHEATTHETEAHHEAEAAPAHDTTAAVAPAADTATAHNHDAHAEAHH